MGLFDYNPPDATVLPPDYEPGFLDDWWYDPDDRRYCLSGPNACSPEAYWTTKDAQTFRSALEGNPNAPAPPGFDPDIEHEERESARRRASEG